MEQQTVEDNLQSVIVAFAKTNIIALPCQVGKHKLSVAVGTGATMNVTSEQSFREVRRSLRRGAMQTSAQQHKCGGSHGLQHRNSCESFINSSGNKEGQWVS